MGTILSRASQASPLGRFAQPVGVTPAELDRAKPPRRQSVPVGTLPATPKEPAEAPRPDTDKRNPLLPRRPFKAPVRPLITLTMAGRAFLLTDAEDAAKEFAGPRVGLTYEALEAEGIQRAKLTRDSRGEYAKSMFMIGMPFDEVRESTMLDEGVLLRIQKFVRDTQQVAALLKIAQRLPKARIA